MEAGHEQARESALELPACIRMGGSLASQKTRRGRQDLGFVKETLDGMLATGERCRRGFGRLLVEKVRGQLHSNVRGLRRARI
jgi:hypothetical protein